MALTSRSLFLYNYNVNSSNYALDFRAVLAGPTLQASLRYGNYSLSSLLIEISRALNAADTAHSYFATADRTFSSGTQNRVSIGTTGTYLDLLFGSGPRNTVSIASLTGFASTDRTGSTQYQGTLTSGTALIPVYNAYNYLGPTRYKKVFGTLNISASGVKEAVVFQTQQFLQAQFKFEPESSSAAWEALIGWMILQKEFDFTPEIGTPTIVHAVTLESSSDDGKGLGFKMTEMLPQFPFYYDTGLMKFRKIV